MVPAPMSRFNPNHNIQGTALLELIVYFGIAASISLAILLLGTQMIAAKNKIVRLEAIERSGRLMGTLITSKIRNAQSINTPLGGATSTTLALRPAGTSTESVTFSLSQNRIEITEGSMPPRRIIDSAVEARTLEFRNISEPNAAGAVRISFTLKSGGVQKQFRLTATMYGKN